MNELDDLRIDFTAIPFVREYGAGPCYCNEHGLCAPHADLIARIVSTQLTAATARAEAAEQALSGMREALGEEYELIAGAWMNSPAFRICSECQRGEDYGNHKPDCTRGRAFAALALSAAADGNRRDVVTAAEKYLDDVPEWVEQPHSYVHRCVSCLAKSTDGHKDDCTREALRASLSALDEDATGRAAVEREGE